MKHQSLTRLFFVRFSWLVRTLPAFAQTAQITGRVNDQANAVVSAVRVTVTNSATGFKREASSNSEGDYTLPLLQPGT
jgi:hypothetical protein